MKKIFLPICFTLVFSLLSLSPLFADDTASKDTAKTEKTEKNENTDKNEAQKSEKMDDNESKDTESLEKKSLESEKGKKSESDSKNSKKKAKVFHDGYLDVNYTLENYYNFKKGLFRLELFAKSGTFNIFCTNSEGKDVPLFSSANLCASTGFLLKIDEKIRRLNSDKRILKEVRHLENGAQLVFTVDNNIRFIIDFSFIASRKSQGEDIIRLTTYSINLGIENHVVDIKGIFDTIAGETSSVHFVTEKGTKIRNEIRFAKEEVLRERTAVCENETTSFQFVYAGEGIQSIDTVVFANVDEIYKMDWDPAVRKGRGFTNIRAYEDSAIMIDWPSFNLLPDQKVENTIFIAAATNDESPRGVDYIDHIDRIIKKAEPPAPENKKEKPAEKKENPEKRTDIDFIVPTIKDYQLDPEYIQALIDKIDALQSSKNVDKKEIQKLNAELDAILAKLRQR